MFYCPASSGRGILRNQSEAPKVPRLPTLASCEIPQLPAEKIAALLICVEGFEDLLYANQSSTTGNKQSEI